MRYTVISEDTWFGAHGWTHTRLIYWEGHEIRCTFHCGIQGYSTPSAVAVRSVDGALCVELNKPNELDIDPRAQENAPHYDYFNEDMKKLCRAIEEKFGLSEEAKLNRPLNLFDCVKGQEVNETGPPSGIMLIARERQRQLDTGLDAAHDDRLNDGSLAQVAACYATPISLYKIDDNENDNSIRFDDPWPESWDVQNDARRKGDSIQDPTLSSLEERVTLLAQAGALIAAEIDRIRRMQERRRLEEEKASQAEEDLDDLPF